MSPSLRLAAWLSVSLCVNALAGSAWAAPPAYRQTASVPLGAPDGWDYLSFDPAARRIYVAHDDRVTVLDATTLAIVGVVPGLHGVQGVIVAGERGHGYAGNGSAGTVTVFDPATLKPIETLPAADDADALAYDPSSRRIFVMNGDSGSITGIDTTSDHVAGTVKIGGSLESAASDGQGHLFVNQAEPAHVLRLDTATMKVTAVWPAPGCISPHGMALDPATHRVFTTCVNARMLVLDSASGRVVATLPIGHGTDAAAFDAARHRIFSSNGDGTLSIVEELDADHFLTRAAVKTAPGARTLALDPATGRIFLVTADVARTEAKRGVRGAPAFRPGTVKLLALKPS